MSTNEWLVADSDMHILEPPDLWPRYMDPRWRYAAPIGLTELQRDMRVKVKKNRVIARRSDLHPARHYIDEFGDDNLVFSTDYPHADAKVPRSTESFLELPFAESSKRKILWDNYAKLYKLPPPTKDAR